VKIEGEPCLEPGVGEYRAEAEAMIGTCFFVAPCIGAILNPSRAVIISER
jgi:hypothetical protein